MAVNLQKGQRVDLTKGKAGLSKVTVGLGWQAASSPRLFGIFRLPSHEIDCDATVFLCNEQGKIMNFRNDIVYYGNLRHSSRSVIHSGDNLVGGTGANDDEQIVIELNLVPQIYSRLVFVVNIYQAVQRNQHFGMVNNAYIRVFDAANNELCRYNLSENYDNMYAMILGEMYRYEGEWRFTAIGQATQDRDILEIANRYR